MFKITVLILFIITIIKQEKIMSLVEDKIAEIKQTIIAEQAEVKAKVDEQSAKIQQLIDQINQGTPSDPADLVAKLEEINAGIKDIFTA